MEAERKDHVRKDAETHDFHDIETDEHARRDHYMTIGYEDEDEDYVELPCHHSFSEEGDNDFTHSFDEFEAGFHHEFERDEEVNSSPVEELHHDEPETHRSEEKHSTPLFLATAANMYLDTTVTKFLQNDISVTKFLEQSNDTTVTKFLDTTVTKFLDENDISVTKFLNQKPDDISVTKFLDSMNFLETAQDDIAVTKYLEFTVIEFLGTATAKFLEANDVSVTKFLETALANFLLDDGAVTKLLEENDITVTKFLDENDISVTKFLDGPASEDNDISVTKFLDSALNKFL